MQRSPGGTDEYKRAQAAINELRGGANEPRGVQTSPGGYRQPQMVTDEPRSIDEARQLQTTTDTYRRTQGDTNEPRGVQMRLGGYRRAQVVTDNPRRLQTNTGG